MYTHDISVCNKWKRTVDPDTNNKDIQLGYWNKIEKCAMLIRKSGKRETVEGTELQIQESIRKKKITSTSEYWKWTSLNKRWRKKKTRSSEERESFWKLIFAAEVSPKE